jgi:hypothetical protein
VARSEDLLAQEKSLSLHQFTTQNADSAEKIIIEPSTDVATDALQESLYDQILAEINHPGRQTQFQPTANKSQLLQKCLHYYPKAKINGDTLIIPYPPQKVMGFKEIKYFIPQAYFDTDNKIFSLQPQIRLDLNPDKSTLKINNSYLLSFYRHPGIKSNSLQQSRQALQYIFNLLLPYTNKSGQRGDYSNRAIVHYKGYKKHEIKLDSEKKFFAFWESLCGQGSLYFYPSKIDDLDNRIVIQGLLYVMKDDVLNAYHFGEITIAFSKQNSNDMYDLQLDFYPFIINKQINN